MIPVPGIFRRRGIAAFFSFSALFVARADACDSDKPDASYRQAADALVQGVRDKAAQSRAWLEMLAERGHVDSQAALGLAYETGRGLDRDHGKALYWHRKAAAGGHAESMKNLGVMHEKGQGVERNMALAETWYRRAAVAGDAKAQRNLGRFYLEGLGGQRNEAEAIKWFRVAAGQNDAKAQLLLGQVLSRSSRPDDQVEAYAWLARAAEVFQDTGLKRQAASLREKIGERLAEPQRRSAEKVLEAFRPRH